MYGIVTYFEFKMFTFMVNVKNVNQYIPYMEHLGMEISELKLIHQNRLRAHAWHLEI